MVVTISLYYSNKFVKIILCFLLFSDLLSDYINLGPPSKVCPKCKVRMWNEERNKKLTKNKAPTFCFCCKHGQVKIPAERKPPPFLSSLLHGGDKSTPFKQNIRTYNSLFQFTSIGGKIDRKINNGQVLTVLSSMVRITI